MRSDVDGLARDRQGEPAPAEMSAMITAAAQAMMTTATSNPLRPLRIHH
jgi:hypothetical protein